MSDNKFLSDSQERSSRPMAETLNYLFAFSDMVEVNERLSDASQKNLSTWP